MNETETAYVDERERLRRWRLILGKDAEKSLGRLGKPEESEGEEGAEKSDKREKTENSEGAEGAGKSGKRGKSGNPEETLSEDEIVDFALQQVYGGGDSDSRQGGLGGSAPRVQRWLGDIRTYFPKSVVQVVQKDAFDRLGLKQMLLEPELLETLEVDVNLVATIISLSKVIPSQTKQTARFVVQKLVDELMKRLASKTIAAARGALNRAARTNRPRQGELDFDRTIRRNLKNWNVEQKKLIADRFVGYARRRRSLREVVLCVDQSYSMGRSVVYSSIFGAVLASVPAIKTRLVFFDTNVVDMTERLTDPVDVLFGAQLGGGTDINGALKYCQGRITQPKKTTFVLITDLYEGGNVDHMFARVEELIRSGVRFICLTALDDEGSPAYDSSNAQKLATLGVPTFACSPDLFPDLMATALNGGDVARWTGRNVATTR